MEELRWILLGVGIIIVAGVYFWGRAKKREKNDSFYVANEEVPSFSATDENDEKWSDGVGPVRVVQSFNNDEMDTFNIDESTDDSAITDNLSDTNDSVPVTDDAADQESLSSDEDEVIKDEVIVEEKSEPAVNDVVALYLVAQRENELKGEQVLSSTFATQLEYGQMNIFHRKDSNGKIIFSMSNMMEPGSFDFDHMHEMTTRGVSLFIQLSLCDDPVKALDDMLICAHSLASMLNAQLCDQNRQLLNETYTKALREKAKGFA